MNIDASVKVLKQQHCTSNACRLFVFFLSLPTHSPTAQKARKRIQNEQTTTSSCHTHTSHTQTHGTLITPIHVIQRQLKAVVKVRTGAKLSVIKQAGLVKRASNWLTSQLVVNSAQTAVATEHFQEPFEIVFIIIRECS